MIYKAIEEIKSQIENQKINLIELRIRERIGIDLDVRSESLKRFPMIAALRTDDGKEHFFYNDGTFEGKHLITFFQEGLNVGFDYSNQINFKLNYY